MLRSASTTLMPVAIRTLLQKNPPGANPERVLWILMTNVAVRDTNPRQILDSANRLPSGYRELPPRKNLGFSTPLLEPFPSPADL
jgi:hypothetical protein